MNEDTSLNNVPYTPGGDVFGVCMVVNAGFERPMYACILVVSFLVLGSQV